MYKYFSLLFSLILLAACGSSSEEEPNVEVESLKYVSVSPTTDTELTPGSQTFVVTFDRNITFASSKTAQITLNGQSVKEAKVQDGVSPRLSITATVEAETNNAELLIPSELILTAKGAKNEKITLAWKVKKIESDIAKSLVNPNANKEAQDLYAKLFSTYGTGTISGAMADVNWNSIYAEKAFEYTGKRPVINCFDFIHLAWSPANWINYDDITPVKEWAAKGGIVACMWHWNVPYTEADYGDVQKMTCTPGTGDGKTTFKPSNCFVDGTWENKIYKEDLAKVIGHLMTIQEAGIPVLWRPYHEARGNYDVYQKGTGAWFWWGSDGAEVFKKLWTDMFEQCKAAGLNNLIWVWTGDEKDTDWYPGDSYVDIVGADIYNKQDVKVLTNQFTAMSAAYPNKMITLSECGNVPDLGSQFSAGAKWLWAMPWYNGGETVHATPEWWKASHNSPYVFTLDNWKK